MKNEMKRRIAFGLLFIGTAIVALMTSHGTMSVDPPNRYLVAKAMIDHGDLKIRKLEGEPLPPGVLAGIDGHLYSHFNVGQSLIFAPCYYVLHDWLGIQSDKLIRSIIALTVYPANLALCVVLFCYLLTLFGLSTRQACLGGLLLMMATGVWQVHKECQESCHLVLLYIVAAIGLRRYELSGSLRNLLLSAVMMALAYLMRFDTAPEIIACLFFMVYLVIRVETRFYRYYSLKWRITGRLLLVVVCMLPAPIISHWICWNHFHHLLPPAGVHLSLNVLLTMGLPGLLISPGRGFFWYNPILILSIPGFWHVWKTQRRWALFIIAFFAGCLLLHGALTCFHGNCNWGPRYLYRTFPLLLIPGLLFVFRERTLPGRIVTRTIVTASIVIQIMAISLHHNRELADLGRAYGGWETRQWTMFEPESNFLKQRIVNLADSIRRMVTNTVPAWPDKPADQVAEAEAADDAVLYYLAFWPYHLTYYLAAVRPQWAWPVWAATLLFLTGMIVGLTVIWGSYRLWVQIEMEQNRAIQEKAEKYGCRQISQLLESSRKSSEAHQQEDTREKVLI